MSAHSLNPGEKWKDVISDNLHRAKTLISLITPESISKPWIYIEWAPFWLKKDSNTYLILTDGVSPTDLPGPMADSQVTYLSSDRSLQKLLEKLGREVHADEDIDYTLVDELLARSADATAEDKKAALERGLGKYRNQQEPLPDDDSILLKVAEFFLDHSENSNFRRVIAAIKSDVLRQGLFFRAMDRGDFDIAKIALSEIEDKGHICQCLIKLVAKRGPEVARPILVSFLEKASGNQTEFAKLASYYLAEGLTSDPAFAGILGKLHNSSAVRRLADWLVQENRISDRHFTTLTDILLTRNPTVYASLMNGMVDEGLQAHEVFRQMFVSLKACGKKVPVRNVLEHLRVAGHGSIADDLEAL